jgi:hypothetical protein
VFINAQIEVRLRANRMFAMPKKTFLADENRVHAELMRLARAGQITYYSALGAAVGKPARWSLWTLVLERISDDELAKGNPDITNLVLSAKTGWPSRIQFTNGKLTPSKNKRHNQDSTEYLATTLPANRPRDCRNVGDHVPAKSAIRSVSRGKRTSGSDSPNTIAICEYTS